MTFVCLVVCVFVAERYKQNVLATLFRAGKDMKTTHSSRAGKFLTSLLQ